MDIRARGDRRSRRPRWERGLSTLLVLGFFGIGYYAVAFAQDPASARSLCTVLDERIPFVPESVWIYVQVYPAALLPLFVVRCPRLFRRIVRAYLLVIGVSLLAFVLLPVTAIDLRPGLDDLDPSRLTGWFVANFYRLDPPVNLFPSLHLALSVLAAHTIRVLWPRGRVVGFAAVAALTVAVCTIKQHFVVDALAGLALGAAASVAIIGPPPVGSAAGRPLAHSWRGPAAFLVLEAGLHAVVVAAWAAGWTL